MFHRMGSWYRQVLNLVSLSHPTGPRQRAPLPEAERLPEAGGVGCQGSGGQGSPDPQGPQDRDSRRREDGQPDRESLQGA